jgi:hypothetical protein
VSKKDSTRWKSKLIFAKEISSDVNQGPVTFSKNVETMYYSRNNKVNIRLKNVNDSTNKLGIYSSEFKDGKWTNVKPFEYNIPLYTFSTPALRHDGGRLYFSSDMPGGYGGLDLYYCERKNEAWDKPVNLGPLVNTPGNEVFPFACKSGKVFFASDGKPGFGGKDLFYSFELNGSWMEPVHLDSAINSPYDDFGLITDTLGEKGYFSSNRNGSDDIFSFSLVVAEFGECQRMIADKYCFTFYDEQQLSDTIPLIYEWDFGGGVKRRGTEVKHCFPGPGDYVVKLSIRDKITGEAIVNDLEYDVSLKDTEHPRFSSYKAGLVNKPLFFDGSKSSCNGTSPKFFWNFGGGYSPAGPVISHNFSKKGEYNVKMGLLQNSGKTCVQEKVRIYNSFEELILPDSPAENLTGATDLVSGSQALQMRIYLMDDLTGGMKDIIKKELIETSLMVVFDKYGIAGCSYNVLEKISFLLKKQPEFRLAMALHIRNQQPGGYDPTEKFAREISFFLNQKGLDKEKYAVDGFGFTPPLFKPYSSRNSKSVGVIELIFMKE